MTDSCSFCNTPTNGTSGGKSMCMRCYLKFKDTVAKIAGDSNIFFCEECAKDHNLKLKGNVIMGKCFICGQLNDDDIPVRMVDLE